MEGEAEGTKKESPLERNAVLAKFRLLYDVRDTDGTLVLGDFVQGRPRKLILSADRLRPFETGLLDCLSRTTSLALREGVPLEDFICYWDTPMAHQTDLISGGLFYAHQILAYCSRVMRALDLPPLEEQPVKTPLDDTESLTHPIPVPGDQLLVYLTLGYSKQDKRLLQVYFAMAPERAFTQVLARGIAEAASLALRHGMPLEKLVEEWKDSQFGSAGFTPNQDVPYMRSIVDYAARYIESKFMK